MTFPKKILVATDFQECSEPALEKAVALAKRNAAKVVVVHAYQVPVFGFIDGARTPSPAQIERILDSVTRAIEAVRTRIEAEGVDAVAVVRDGNPAEVIAEVRKEHGCDVVIVGTHGHGRLGRALLGSVAQNVLRTVDVPVLVVRSVADER
jgi:nucleotide-binding universal stress UspA family protein